MDGSKNCGMYIQWNTTQQKKEGTPHFYNSMDGTGEYYAEWNKSVKDKYDLNYKRNLMNKIN